MASDDEPRLISQPGGGSLLSGGRRGHRGGGGRPRSALRGSAREVFGTALEMLQDAQAAGELPPPGIEFRDWVRALKIIGDFALQPDPEAPDPDDLMAIVVDVLREHHAEHEIPEAAKLVDALSVAWKDALNG